MAKKPAMPHTGHEKHLCYLANIGYQQSHASEFKELVKEGQYFCKACGRVAAEPENLCKPAKI